MTSKPGRFKGKSVVNYVVVAAIGAGFAVASATVGLPPSTLFMLEKICIGMLLAVSLSLVVGFLGELSLGHAGFMCVGAYLGGKISALLEPSLGNGPSAFLISLVVGGSAAAVCGLVVGLPALRVKGDYLAIVTLAFGEIVRSLFQNTGEKTFGGALGLDTPRYDKNKLFVYGFILVLASTAVIQNLIRSKHGRAITAIRDNEIAARATGVDVTKYKLAAFMISAFFAGVAGVLYSYGNYTVQSFKFGFMYSIEILIMVVLGGMGSVGGVIFSAALIIFLNAKLATILMGDLAVLQNLIYALILVAIVVYKNAPALQKVRETYNFNSLLKRAGRRKRGDAHAAGKAEAAANGSLAPERTEPAPERTDDKNAAVPNRGGEGTEQTQEYILEVENLSIAFGGLKAVDDFNLKVKKNQIYGLVGPNGAGKTTIFNMLTGVYKPMSGTIRLCGEDIAGKSQNYISRKGIARTFQNIRLFNKMTVAQNAMVGLNNRPEYACGLFASIFRLPRHFKTEAAMNEGTDALLRIFGLEGERDNLSRNLPYGKQRKLEIARALATNPKLLLLDEPAAGMNPNETAELMDAIRLIRDKFDVTVLLIEHDMKFVSGFCDEVTVINFGTVLARGSVSEALNDPEVIKAYIGG